MSPQNGALTESEIRRYGAMAHDVPLELAVDVIDGLFCLLRAAETREAKGEKG